MISPRDLSAPQVVLGLLCAAKCAAKPAAPAAGDAAATKPAAAGEKKDDAAAAAGVPPLTAMATIDFWLLLVPKALTFTYTQFFMNYIPQLLVVNYGYSHGAAASLGGVAQGGSVVGLMVVGNHVYKKLDAAGKARMTFAMLVVCTVVPALLASSAALPFDIAPLVVPLCVVWGGAYVLPFYLPVGEYAMATGGTRCVGKLGGGGRRPPLADRAVAPTRVRLVVGNTSNAPDPRALSKRLRDRAWRGRLAREEASATRTRCHAVAQSSSRVPSATATVETVTQSPSVPPATATDRGLTRRHRCRPTN